MADVKRNMDITYFAKTKFRNTDQTFGIKRKDRRQHMYVLGKSGTGKSVLLSNMIIQNINDGEGVCVVDPHGELVEGILASIPPERAKDVVYFNPADTDYHLGFNVLELLDPRYKHLVASGLMGIFTKIWANAWSSRMEYILNNAILALLDTPGSTLLGIPRLLVDKDYRQQILSNLKDPVVKAFWMNEYEQWRDQFRNEAIAPIQNKVGQFLSTSIIRNVVGQPKSTIDIFNIMNTGKIFLVNVSKGRVGEDNSALLGGMIITKIQLAAMERVRIPENERKDFYLYVDEFQNFVTDSFASILSEARKYRLNLTIAHQYIGQLVTKDSDTVRDAVFGNVGTMIIFRVGAADAEFLEKEFEPEFDPEDFVNLPNYHVYLKLMVDGVTSRPFSASTLPPIEVSAEADTTEKILEMSRRLYARPRQEVEDEITRWSGMMSSNSGALSSSEGGKFKAKCMNCGIEIMVPFEPQEGRPVYCKDCLQKIRSGEVVPPPMFKKSAAQESKRTSDLSKLGIEFAETEKEKSKAPMPSISKPPFMSVKKFQDNRPKFQNAKSMPKPEPLPANFPKKLIKKIIPQRHERSGPDILGLQKILGEVMDDTLKKTPSITLKDNSKKEPQISSENKDQSAFLPEEKPRETMSLHSLNNVKKIPIPITQIKEPTEENKAQLKAALAKANILPKEIPSINEAKQIEAEQKFLREAEKSFANTEKARLQNEANLKLALEEKYTKEQEELKEKEEEKTEAEKQPAPVVQEEVEPSKPKKREVPEDVLRKILG